MTDNSLKQFLEREFERLHARIDRVEQQGRNILALQRTNRALITQYGEHVQDLTDTIEKHFEAPKKRTFPLSTMEEIENTAHKFEDPDHTSSLKREISYAISNTKKDEWLRAVLTDQVTAEFHLSGDIWNLNFIQHLITNITFTPEKTFTAMVTQAKGRVYSKQRREAKKRLSSPGSSKENFTNLPDPLDTYPKSARIILGK